MMEPEPGGAPIDWTRDWSKASDHELSDALEVMANAIGGEEADLLSAAALRLYRYAVLNGNLEETHHAL